MGDGTMKRGLDLADIQGNIVRPYGRFGFPIARHLFFNVANASAGRRFIERTRRAVTTAERWAGIDDDPDPNVPSRPQVAVNIGLSFLGLLALELSTETLRHLPEEFIDGMAKRSHILGDIGTSAPDRWDPIWVAAAHERDRQVHIWISLSAQAKPDGTPVDALAERTEWLQSAALESGGVALLEGHRGGDALFQSASALMQVVGPGQRAPTAKEHFGFTDGIGDPVFTGQFEPAIEASEVIGNGKVVPGDKGWAPLATGEFILGHASESQELTPTAPPWSFMRNGTFMAYRKLHQNVASFRDYAKQQANLYQRTAAMESEAEAEATIRAKIVGRWSNGIPLAVAPTFQASRELAAKWSDIPALQLKGAAYTAAELARLAAYERLLCDFRYGDDLEGIKCPVTAHIRRSNPRDGLHPMLVSGATTTPTSSLSNRRRILRRGLPYGVASPPDDAGEHGVVFMALCASLFDQFEFVQQQWMQYGGSFNAGNDTDPLVGLRRPGAKFVIPADPAGSRPPFICAELPSFVETRGGEYFFLPSLTALRQIAAGSVDPT
jgi:Dyp-type peroxidase family